MKQGIEWQVSNLQLSKKLAELGVKQESLFWWVWFSGNHPEGIDGAYYIINNQELKESTVGKFSNAISAFTVAELGEMLPSRFLNKSGKTVSDRWFTNFAEELYYKTEADARAKMLIYLIENKLVGVNKC